MAKSKGQESPSKLEALINMTNVHPHTPVNLVDHCWLMSMRDYCTKVSKIHLQHVSFTIFIIINYFLGRRFIKIEQVKSKEERALLGALVKDSKVEA